MVSLIRDAMPSYVRQAYDEVEKLQRINGEIENGEVLRVVELRKADGIKYVGKVGEILRTEKKSKPFLDEIDLCSSEDVFVKIAVEKAVKKCAALKTEKRDVVKQRNNVEKPAVLELPLIALHGRNATLNELLSWKVFGRMVNAAASCR